MKHFIGTCVDNPFHSVERLSHIIEKGRRISKRQFCEECDVEETWGSLMKLYPDDFQYFQYGNIMYFTHSAIENFYC